MANEADVGGVGGGGCGGEIHLIPKIGKGQKKNIGCTEEVSFLNPDNQSGPAFLS